MGACVVQIPGGCLADQQPTQKKHKHTHHLHLLVQGLFFVCWSGRLNKNKSKNTKTSPSSSSARSRPGVGQNCHFKYNHYN